jgi:hypothetical protein
LVFLALLAIGTLTFAQDNTFSGTYTYVVGDVVLLTIQTNMFGQEVGFCQSGNLPYGYSCFQPSLGQAVITGSVVADGKGNITTGSNYVLTFDVNSQKCSSKFNAAPDCPYKVPSGIAWSSTASYVVGDEVDFTVAGKVLTFQAVKSNMNVPPNTSTCSSTVTNPPNCDWDQLYVSALGQPNSNGTITGTYAVQANGSAVSKLNLVSAAGKASSLSFAMVVPTSPLAVGQEVPLVLMPLLGGGIRGVGTAVRTK